MKRKWVLIALSVGLLGAAITGGAALAHGFRDGGHSSGRLIGQDASEQQAALAARVAAILGADEQATADAMAQVQEEMQTEQLAEFRAALETMVQDAVDGGKITQEDADEFLAAIEAGGWRGFGKRGHHGRGFNHYGDGLDGAAKAQEYADRVGEVLGVDGADVADAFGQAKDAIFSERLDAKLQEAVDSGKITQEEADEIRARIESDDWRGFGKHGGGRRGGFGAWGVGHHGGLGPSNLSFATAA